MPDHRRFALVAFAATLLLALPGRATSPSPGTVRLLSAPERPYRSLQLAIDAARDGDIVRLGPGTFEEAIRVAGKDLRLVGAGVGETTLRGPGALLTVAADARVRIESLSLACTARGGDKPLSAVYVEGDGFWMSECEVRDAAGFAVEIAKARRDVEIFGSTFLGCGGGVLLEEAGARIVGNVVTESRGPALVLGAPPALAAPVVVEHNTLLAGEGPEAPPLLAARVPGGEPRVTFGYNVISGAVPPEILVPLSRDTLDYANVAVPPADRRSFFEDVGDRDYRPSDAQKKDAAGLEMGARLSEDGAEDLRPAVEDALDQGRLSEGLRLIRWLPDTERGPYLDRARAALYTRFVENVEAKRFGLALRDFFFVQAEAPAEWGIRDRFRVALHRVLPPYETRIDWSQTFPEGSELGAQLAQLLAAGAATTGRPSAEGAAVPTWTIEAVIEAPLRIERNRAAIHEALPTPNPDYRAVEEAIAIEKRRRERAERDREKAAERLEVAKAQGRDPNSAYYKARARKLDKALEKIVDIDRGLRKLEDTRKSIRGSFSFRVEGQREDVKASARALVHVTGPSGKKQQLSVALARKERFVRAKPLPALDWPGLEGRTADELSERDRYLRLFADTLISAVLNAVERRDIDRIVALLGAAGARRATDADLSELYELVALYAPRLDGALQGAREIESLWAELKETPEATEPRFRIVQDPKLDRSPPLVVLAESGAERPRIEARIAAIQHRYALYQGVISQLEDYFAALDGRRLDDFLRMALDARR